MGKMFRCQWFSFTLENLFGQTLGPFCDWKSFRLPCIDCSLPRLGRSAVNAFLVEGDQREVISLWNSEIYKWWLNGILCLQEKQLSKGIGLEPVQEQQTSLLNIFHLHWPELWKSCRSQGWTCCCRCHSRLATASKVKDAKEPITQPIRIYYVLVRCGVFEFK